MAKLQDEIYHTFLEKLEGSDNVTHEMVTALRELLSAKGKLKVDDLVDVFSPSVGGDVK